MPQIIVPDYAGGSLVNLVAELEQRLRGSAESPGLRADLSRMIPEADTYVLALFDGLGATQLDHHAAEPLRRDLVATVDAPFPTTTTVSLASVATGRPPSQHGLLGYQLWLPEVGKVVNTIWWTTLWGEPIEFDTTQVLPSPNLWERLRASGIEPIAVQPAHFEGSRLTNALYRGCRFEGVTTEAEWVDAVVDLAKEPGRFIFAYLPHIDFAAHVSGQASPEYDQAMRIVSIAWDEMARRLPEGATAVGTADHGHVDFPPERRAAIPEADQKGLRLYGDARVMFVKGDGKRLADDLPATWLDLDEMRGWWGHGPAHPSFSQRAPDGVLVADDGWLLLHVRSDTKLIGNHGGLTDEERLVPVVIASSQ